MANDVLEQTDVDAMDAYSRVVTHVADVVLPSVASLRVTRRVAGGRRPTGTGSAVILSSDGLLATSAHVVDRADGGTASLADGRSLEFEVLGADALSDLAVLRVDVGGLRTASLGDAAKLRVGQLVVAVGSPLGYSGSVSAGVVSGLGRSLPTSDGRNARVVDNVIQTDASLHPGNSGGALAVSNGDVVGVATAVVGPGIGQGLGMAVPLDDATKAILGALVRDGRVRRAWLGVAGGSRPLPPRIAIEVGRERGVEVTAVVRGSPAERAGLRPEDLIVGLDGKPVERISDLQRLLTGGAVDRTMALDVARGGTIHTVDLMPTELD